ncbi:MAG: hypothetical protein WKF96_01615 [Solirubrobacteraceae bacterium]
MKRVEDSEEFFELPYGERRGVIVVPDALLTPPARREPQTPPHEATRRQRALGIVRDRLPVRRAEPANPTLQVLAELREDGVLIRPVPQSQARALDLPVGHPLPDVVYVGNPANRRYYPAADFHRKVFEHKFAEAVRLVMALGATRMTVQWERGWRKELSADLDSPLHGLARAVGSARATADRSSSLLFEANLLGGEPSLPTDLVWYDHEPTWRSVADGRLKHGLSDFSLTVRSTEDYGINGDFAAKVRRKKLLTLGGEFTAHTETSWRIDGVFAETPPPRSRRW